MCSPIALLEFGVLIRRMRNGWKLGLAFTA